MHYLEQWALFGMEAESGDLNNEKVITVENFALTAQDNLKAINHSLSKSVVRHI